MIYWGILVKWTKEKRAGNLKIISLDTVSEDLVEIEVVETQSDSASDTVAYL